MEHENDLDALLDRGLVFRGRYRDQGEFFSDVSRRLQKAGHVGPGFERAIVERERQFPTGLRLPAGDICLPHTDPAYVASDGIAIVSFEEPVAFREMGDPDETVQARAAFVLFMTDSKRHLAFLQQVVRAIQAPDLFERIEARLGSRSLAAEGGRQ